MGYSSRLCDHVWAISADYRSDSDGGYLGMKKSTPFGLGTLRDDTFTFGCLLFGTIVIVGALLFLPVATLGPVADHLGPIPFGG